jgi:hypothetical protein
MNMSTESRSTKSKSTKKSVDTKEVEYEVNIELVRFGRLKIPNLPNITKK